MSRRSQIHSRAYLCGWRDGRFEEPRCFTDNHRLAEHEAPSDRLDYYRGHRAGREALVRHGGLLEAS